MIFYNFFAIKQKAYRANKAAPNAFYNNLFKTDKSAVIYQKL